MSKKIFAYTFDEFKNQIYTNISGKIILKEAKRMLTLFFALSQNTKSKLKVEGYFEFITLANEFFNFYSMCKKFRKKSFENLEAWQNEKISDYELMKKEYENYLAKNNFIPYDFVESEENMNFDFVNQFKKIIFVDVIEFSPLDKFLIEKLEQNFDVEFILQLSNQNDFDEQNLELSNNFNIQNAEFNKIEIFKVGEEMELAANLISYFDGKIGNDIFTPNISKNTLHKTFPKYFNSIELKVLDDTELYNFFKIQHDLLASLVHELHKALSLLTLEKYINSNSFKKNYEITTDDIKTFYKILDNNYQYFSRELLEDENFLRISSESFNDKLLKIYFDILKISELKSVEEFLDFYKNNINILNACEKNYSDIIERLFEAFDLAKTSESLENNFFNKIFPENISLGIFTLIIKYMNNIELREIFDSQEKISVIKNIELAKERHTRDSFFVDITSSNLPGPLNDGLIFTEFQRRTNGLLTLEQARLQKKYRFFQNILTSKSSIIYFAENKNQSVFISPFLEELATKLNLEIQDAPLTQNIILENLKFNFSNSNIILDLNLQQNNSQEKNQIEKNISEDISERKIILGAYDYEELKKCEYKFFLKNILGLTHIKGEINKNLSSKFFGTFVHEFLEQIGKEKSKDIEEKNNFEVSDELLERKFWYLMIKNKYKIPLHTENYFRKILFKTFSENIKRFYKYLEIIFSGEQVQKFSSEKSESNIFIKDEILSVKLSGRVDLNIESEKQKLIFDYKTGNINALQLDFYSILLYGDENLSSKYIFNPLKKGVPEEQKKISLTVADMKEKIQNFIDVKYYSKAEKASDCLYCDYFEICRKELD
ncbi:MAG: PD-(D/E)XK nuclease family protein [Fusobacteriaceae bacterium]